LEAEIRRMIVQSQQGLIVWETLSWKTLHRKRDSGVAQDVGPESKLQYWKKKKRSDGCSCVGLCLGTLFSSIDLCVCFCTGAMLFLLLLLCSKIWGPCCGILNIALFAQTTLAIRIFSASIWILKLIFLFLQRMALVFDGHCIESVHCF
jgi:hypothetical protein